MKIKGTIIEKETNKYEVDLEFYNIPSLVKFLLNMIKKEK